MTAGGLGSRGAARLSDARGLDPLAGTVALPPPPPAWNARRMRLFLVCLVGLDATAVALALLVAAVARFGLHPTGPDRVAVGVPALLLGPAWLAALAAGRAYELRFLGVGAEEYRRVARATGQVFAAVAIIAFAGRLGLARGFVGVALPVGLVALLAGRWAARRWLGRQRGSGRLCHRVVVLGDRVDVVQFVAQLRRAPDAGLVVVGALLPEPSTQLRTTDEVPVLGSYADVAAVVRVTGADTVAVASSAGLGGDRLRRIAWALEGRDVSLIVAPALTDVAGPRVTVRPVAGLPLLYVDEPRLSGAARLVKGSMDRVSAAVGLVLTAPLLAAVALAVRLSSPGPVLFVQPRIGRGGDVIHVWKFRTMVDGAAAAQPALADGSHASGLLFKVDDDPRVTRLGHWLRRTSLDELPQLVNVLRGEMSLVGPRPLAVDADAFVGDEHRRHLVKPGITGLWQVSGRRAQSWEDAVRLDLYYVENWSLTMDLAILARTVTAVLHGR